MIVYVVGEVRSAYSMSFSMMLESYPPPTTKYPAGQVAEALTTEQSPPPNAHWGTACPLIAVMVATPAGPC
jgi:hypothetical protein